MKFLILAMMTSLTLTSAFAGVKNTGCSVKVIVDLELANTDYYDLQAASSEIRSKATSAIQNIGCRVIHENDSDSKPSAILDITGFQMGFFKDFAISLEKDSLDVNERKQIYLLEKSPNVKKWVQTSVKAFGSDEFISAVKSLQ